MTVTSTVPGAVALLRDTMQAVADANRSMNVGVYVGQFLGGVRDNFFCIGLPESGGEAVVEHRLQINGSYALGATYLESYGLRCMIRALGKGASSDAAVERVSDAFTLLSGLITQLSANPHGKDSTGTPVLTEMGVWEVADVENPAIGKLDAQGVGCVLLFTVHVTDALLRNV